MVFNPRVKPWTLVSNATHRGFKPLLTRSRKPTKRRIKNQVEYNNTRKNIAVEAFVHAPEENVWGLRTNPAHIIHWNQASDAWHTPMAENDLRAGRKFLTRMETRDGSAGFNFCGIFEEVKIHLLIIYTIEDGRKVNRIYGL